MLRCTRVVRWHVIFKPSSVEPSKSYLILVFSLYRNSARQTYDGRRTNAVDTIRIMLDARRLLIACLTHVSMVTILYNEALFILPCTIIRSSLPYRCSLCPVGCGFTLWTCVRVSSAPRMDRKSCRNVACKQAASLSLYGTRPLRVVVRFQNGRNLSSLCTTADFRCISRGGANFPQ